MHTQAKGLRRNFFFGLMLSAALLAQSFAQETGHRTSRTAFSHPLPELNGNKLHVEGVEVTYGPGAVSPAHSHPCPVIGYVVSGSIRTKVQGQPEAVYKAGESFYEPPDGVHLISGNASATEPAKLLAFFVCDHVAPLSTPVKPEQK
ncbi:MAG: cupin domain-containing protein [Acidobacteriota bacterium]|nr:cupin domain-containing protein [Acidobacteriota bacterium]